MKPCLRPLSCLVLAAGLLCSAAGRAAGCDALSAEIDAKIRAAGVTHFTLTTVDAGAPAAGKVVGSCDLGSKKIVYAPQAAAAPDDTASTAAPAPALSPAPARRPRQAPILTECRDGTVSMGGDCRN